MAAFPRLFAPGRIGRLELRNRILMAPMEKNLATAAGAVTQRYIDYVEARAAGGAALILLESMYVHPAGRNHLYQLGIHDDALVPGYRRLVEACHRHGALVGAELELAGRETSSAVTGTQPVAPSPVPCTTLAGGEMPRALSVREIAAIVGEFAEAARRAVAAGFDMIEIHGAHGYLVGQFLSPYANKRKDEYGGDFERRLRFPLDVIAAVREAVGPGTPLLYRLSAEEHVEGAGVAELAASRAVRAMVLPVALAAAVVAALAWASVPDSGPTRYPPAAFTSPAHALIGVANLVAFLAIARRLAEGGPPGARARPLLLGLAVITGTRSALSAFEIVPPAVFVDFYGHMTFLLVVTIGCGAITVVTVVPPCGAPSAGLCAILDGLQF